VSHGLCGKQVYVYRTPPDADCYVVRQDSDGVNRYWCSDCVASFAPAGSTALAAVVPLLDTMRAQIRELQDQVDRLTSEVQVAAVAFDSSSYRY